MYLGYNTNGLAHHRWSDALELLRELGYDGVGLTIDHALLDPQGFQPAEQLRQVGQRLRQLGLRSVIETGARFLLDPRRRHEPTLISADAAARERRVDFLKYAIDVASELRSDCVSLWSGAAPPETPAAELWDRLQTSLRPVLDHADRRRVMLGFEPEPEMLVSGLADYWRLRQRVDSPWLRLTLDVGHVHCLGVSSAEQAILEAAGEIVNLHLEDMRRGVHEHLMFGEGEMDFPAIFSALQDINYSGGAFVELSRHSHHAVAAAGQARDFLRALIPT